MQHPNESAYTLDTVPDTEPLLAHDPASYGALPRSPSPARLLLAAALRMAALFLVATLVLGGTLFLALPTLDPCVSSLPLSPRSPPTASIVPSSTYPNRSMISRHSTAS